MGGGVLGAGFRVTGGRRIGGGVLGAGRGMGLQIIGGLGGAIGGRRMGRPTGVGGLGGDLLGAGRFDTGVLIPDSPGNPLVWPKAKQSSRPTIAQTYFILIAFKSWSHSDLNRLIYCYQRPRTNTDGRQSGFAPFVFRLHSVVKRFIKHT